MENLIKNINSLSVRELVEYMEIVDNLLKKYEKMLMNYSGIIMSNDEPWFNETRNAFDKCNIVYNYLIEESQKRIENLMTEKKEDNTSNLIIENIIIHDNTEKTETEIKDSEEVKDSKNNVKVKKVSNEKIKKTKK